MREIGHSQHHQQRHQNAGQNARQKQGSNTDIGHHAVDHKGQARWNDGPQCGRSGGDAHRKLAAVAVVFHGLDLHRAQAGRISNGGAAHAGKNHRADHIDMAQSPFEPTHQGQRIVENPVGDAGIVHQVAGQNKEGHSQQRKAVNAADHAVDHHKGRRGVLPKQVDHGGPGHGNGHRDAARHQNKKDDF